MRLAMILAFPVAALIVGQGCSGSGKGQGVFSSLDQRFTLSASPASLDIPSGGSGYLTVSATRYGGFSEAITLSVPGLPSGVVASGSVAAGSLTGRLTITVADGVAAQSLGSLALTGISGNRVQTAPLVLSVLAALPPATIPPGEVQASGSLQTGGNLANQAAALEPVEAVAVHDSTGNLEVRHGFLPVPQPSNP